MPPMKKKRRPGKRYPTLLRASQLLRRAVRLGTVTRGPCYAAGPTCGGDIQAHHHDYSKPLDVVWCCFVHHRGLDSERRRGTPLEEAKKQRALNFMELLRFAQMLPDRKSVV